MIRLFSLFEEWSQEVCIDGFIIKTGFHFSTRIRNRKRREHSSRFDDKLHVKYAWEKTGKRVGKEAREIEKER